MPFTTEKFTKILKDIFGLIIYGYLIYSNVENGKEVSLIVWAIPALIMGIDLSNIVTLFKK